MKSIAVTGVGAVSALGPNIEEGWQNALNAADDTIQPIVYFDASGERSNLAAQAKLESIALDLPHAHSRSDLMSICAVQEALDMSGLSRRDYHKAGVFVGAGTGGLHLSEQVYKRCYGSKSVIDFDEFLAHNGDASAQWVASYFGLKGPCRAVMTACSSSVLAIGEALDQLRLGLLDVAVVGGADSITQLTHAGFNSLQAVDAAPCRPFDADRAGMNLGECAAFLVLESHEHALERGAKPIAFLRGYGLSCDAHHMTAPPDDGDGAVRAMNAALANAEIAADQIQVVNAHATATPLNDSAETCALTTVFGSRNEPLYVTGTKSMTGHCLGAAGAMEAVLTVLSLRDQMIPRTLRNQTSILQEPFHLVTKPRFKAKLQFALSNSFAFGGNNGVLVFEQAG